MTIRATVAIAALALQLGIAVAMVNKWEKPSSSEATISPTARFDLQGHPSVGGEGAALTLVEFINYRCPYCEQAERDTFVGLRDKYVATGRARWVVFDVPGDDDGMLAAEAARCADAQGKYWEARKRLLADVSAPVKEIVDAMPEEIGLAEWEFQQCLGRHQMWQAINADLELVQRYRSQVSGAPTLFLGSERAGKFEGLSAVVGNQSPDAYRSLIEVWLAHPPWGRSQPIAQGSGL